MGNALTTTTSTSLLARSASASPALLSAVSDLFTRMSAAIGGDKIAMLYVDSAQEDVQQEWALGLMGYRGRELERGLAGMRGRIFAPNLGEFQRLCRPALDPEWAWHEAQAGLQERAAGRVGAWSHPAVWRAATAMSWELRTKTFAAARRQWEMTLAREFAAGWGEEVPEPAPRIEHQPSTRPMTVEQKQQLKALAKSFLNGAKR